MALMKESRCARRVKWSTDELWVERVEQVGFYAGSESYPYRPKGMSRNYANGPRAQNRDQ